MSTPYDEYDYSNYWEGREYEHECEVIAIKDLLEKIPKIRKIAEIGSGFGRLTPYYVYRSKKTVLVDPSINLLRQAKSRLKSYLDKNNFFKGDIEYLKSKIENLEGKLPNNSFDLVIMVRVLHHIQNPAQVFKIVKKLLTKNGFFILEFANKVHGKAFFQEFLRGNFTFPIDIFPLEKSTKKKAALPFLNYHPELLKQELKTIGFKVVAERSVSNIRNQFLKKHFPLSLLLTLEKFLQTILVKIHFGPSVFLLLQKES